MRTGASGLQAAQALLELFRAAQELPSAEFLVVHEHGRRSIISGSTEQAFLQQAVAALRRLFGTRAKYLRADNGAASFTGASYLQVISEYLNTRPSLEKPSCCRHAGAAAAAAKYVLLIDSSVLVTRGCLFAMWSTLQSRPSAGLVGPLLLGEDGKVPSCVLDGPKGPAAGATTACLEPHLNRPNGAGVQCRRRHLERWHSEHRGRRHCLHQTRGKPVTLPVLLDHAVQTVTHSCT